MRRGLLGLAAALAVAGGAGAAERTAVKPAIQAFPFLKEYYALEPALRSRFALTYRLNEHGRTLHAPMTLADGAGETVLAATPDGWLTRLPGPDALARGAKVSIRIPAETKAGVAMAPEAVLRDPGEVAVADLRAAADQISAVTRRYAGPLSFAAPKFSRVIFSGAEGATLTDADGRSTPLPVLRGGAPVLDLAEAGRSGTVRFAKPPYHALLAPAGR